MEVRWIAFPLHPETPPEGQSLEDLFQGRNIDIGAVLGRLKQVAADLGLPFGDRRMTYNSRPAQELSKWAEGKGRGDAFHLAVFKAYFADGLNICRPEVLGKIAESAGLDPSKALSVLAEGRYRKSVDDDWARCSEAGIAVAPTFAMGGEYLEGAIPYQALAALVSRHGAVRRKEAS